ncbi:MAG: Na+/H+ antiporter NhaC family protein [Termitinemataceae bacterium]|nr:MAG: Na+/H+ antiporter NhaC family protein [Termitinemataceae bacterium]
MEFTPVDVGFWSVVPPLFAIALALITKEVIVSLFLGIICGVMIYVVGSGENLTAIFHTTTDLIVKKVGDNAAMVIFLAMLGAVVALIARAGGAKAYGVWAVSKLKKRQSSTFLTAILGILIFIDDYFNCLTVGTVMKPVTDRFKVSREKLAYLIDSTAAPICVIAPISSWAAAVVSYAPFVNGMSGMKAFVMAIPINLYAVLTIFMVIVISLRKKGDFGPMLRAELRAKAENVMSDGDISQNDDIARLKASEDGKVIDLVLPVIALIVFCVIAMLFYGGFWDGTSKSIRDSFADTDAGHALSLGGILTILACFALYMPRKLISFKDFFAAITDGVKAMVPAMVILTLAWTISGVCKEMLATGIFVAEVVQGTSLIPLIPLFLFLCACGISFATGTSWGTFGILIPISVDICNRLSPELSLTCLAAVMGGGVFGDHCSPISDSTILSSTGAGCKHIDHIATQIPYALTTASACIVGYVIAGFVTGPLGFAKGTAVSLFVSAAILIALLIVLPKISHKNEQSIE